MKTIYFNVVGSAGGGGPSVFSFKAAQCLIKRGYTIIYDKPQKSDIALCIIETGKTLHKINRNKTKVVLRSDGIYCKEYWHGGSGREWRSDMTALHNKLKSDIPAVDHMVYQSKWSKDIIDDEIIKRSGPWSIIHNGVDVKLFRPSKPVDDGIIKLFHIGKIRNHYIMESLIDTYEELKKRGHDVRLYIAGSMDAECTKVFQSFKVKMDPNVIYLGGCPNTKAPPMFNYGNIYLGPRMGSSSDNVIVEALASGLPVVCPKWGGNSEMIEHGLTGAIVDGGHWNYDEKYVKNLADGVELVMSDLKSYQTRARQHAVKHLNIDLMIDKYLKAMGL